MEWIKLTDRMPNPDEHDRVLIYTEGSDFNGERVFDVKAETLNECFYADPEDQPEVCKHATHWAVHPRDAGLHPTRQQGDLLTLLADIKRFDIQNLSLDLPQDIRARIERALIGWGDLTAEQKATDALRSLMDALPTGTQTSMTVFRSRVHACPDQFRREIGLEPQHAFKAAEPATYKGDMPPNVRGAAKPTAREDTR